MQTQPSLQTSYGMNPVPARRNSDGLILTAFLITLFAFILILAAGLTHNFVLNPFTVKIFKAGRNFYTGMMYFQTFLGLCGTLGFILGMSGVASAIKQKSEFKYFQGIASLALGFIGLLTLIEYIIKLVMTLLKL